MCRATPCTDRGSNLAIEADGVLLGRARLQLFRPLSVHLADAIKLHFGAEEELAVDPALVALDPKAGRNLDVSLRNNSPQIQSFVVEAQVRGLGVPAAEDRDLDRRA